MARRLKKWPKKYTSYARKTQIRDRYPWDEWMDGSIWEAKRGEDFVTSIRQFQTTLHARVHQTGKPYYLKTRRTGANAISFCFVLQDPAWLEEDDNSPVPFGPDEEEEG